MKTHLSFATTNIATSIEFYSTLLNAEPIKTLPDYALFITEQPALELALAAVDSTPRVGSDHFGIAVKTTDDVEQAIARLGKAGLVSSIEREQTCCYANQTKVWTTDPMGRRWEVYAVHEETEERDSSDSACCKNDVDVTPGCCGTDALQ